jgi:putative transposase
MTELDKQYLKTPFNGIRRMTAHLRSLGHSVNHKRVQRLMRKMGMEAVYRKPNTSLPNKEHTIYPYLLKGLKITRPNQVWATDITYIPMAKGFMYLIAIVDLYSRKILTWSVSNTMEAEWCAEVLKQAINEFGKPEIFNTDQGSQFTSNIFTQVLKDNQVQILMPQWNWMVKAELLIIFLLKEFGKVLNMSRTADADIYLKSYQNGTDLRKGLEKYFDFYNRERFHQSLSYQTPDKVYLQVA